MFSYEKLAMAMPKPVSFTHGNRHGDVNGLWLFFSIGNRNGDANGGRSEDNGEGTVGKGRMAR